jgi:DNA-binding response OmpR family regulator
MEELIVRINNLIKISGNGKSKSHQENIVFGVFEFNTLRYELKSNQNQRKLSHREASLLQILSENKNATIQRKDILLKLWGDDSFFNSRNLDVYITKLRDYLKEDPSVEIITIKGIGYQFVTG